MVAVGASKDWDAWLAGQFEPYKVIEEPEKRRLIHDLTAFVRDRYWSFPLPGVPRMMPRTIDYDEGSNFLVIEFPDADPGVGIAVRGDRQEYASLVPPLAFTRGIPRTRGLVRLRVPNRRALSAAKKAIILSASRAGVPTVQDRESAPSPSVAGERLRRITIDPAVCGGKPCIRGMRVRVSDVLSLLASGLTPGMVLAELPRLEPDDIRACLDYAAMVLAQPRSARAG